MVSNLSRNTVKLRRQIDFPLDSLLYLYFLYYFFILDLDKAIICGGFHSIYEDRWSAEQVSQLM